MKGFICVFKTSKGRDFLGSGSIERYPSWSVCGESRASTAYPKALVDSSDESIAQGGVVLAPSKGENRSKDAGRLIYPQGCSTSPMEDFGAKHLVVME